MASSSLIHPVMKDGECRNWAELPYELTSSILRRLSSIDILENAQKVCTWWRHVCKDPEMWRKIDMPILRDAEYDHEIMCRHAVDRSQGGLLEIDITCFGSDSLLNYIADRSSNLRSLELALISPMTTEGLTEAIGKLPLLEELEVTEFEMLADYLKVVGQSCPKLKTLKLNRIGTFGPPLYVSDDDALAIAETMHGLRNLTLLENSLTDAGLKAILDNCPDLEHLDLGDCFNVHFSGDLEKRCSERIKMLRRPNDGVIDIDLSIFEDSVTLDTDYYQ